MIGMLNKAPCPCVRCGEIVKTGDGHFVKIPGKGWKVEHGMCPVIQRAQDTLDRAALDGLAARLFEATKRSLK